MNRSSPAPRTPASQPAAAPRLRVVARSRQNPGRLRRTGIVVTLVLLSGLFITGAVQAVVTEAQGRIDQLNTQIQEATARDRELRLRRAELLAPARLRAAAHDRLGMVTPTTIVYLVPSQPPAP